MDLDDTFKHNLWPDGVVRPAQNNRFTHYLHKRPGYDDPAQNVGRWGIDGYGPVMKDISERFALAAGKKKP